MARFLILNIILLFMDFSTCFIGVPLLHELGENERCETSKSLEIGKVCADGLKCLPVLNEFDNDSNVLRCLDVQKVSKSEKCVKEKCKIVFMKCPSDSRSLIRVPENDECCGSQPSNVCQCDLQLCRRLIPTCDTNQERILIRSGVPNQPGNCCDQFECRKRELHCENVKCPDSSEIYDFYAVEGESCPEDSYRPTKYVPQGSCCPIIPQCQCKAAICQPVNCQHDEIPIIEQNGNGRPGRCCPRFRCATLLNFNSNESEEMRQKQSKKAKSALSYCVHEGKSYAKGETWHTDPCQICSCNGDVALCKKIQCPLISHNCNWVGIPADECCPICLGCKDDSGTYKKIGDFWTQDDCTNCTCGEDFQWHCQKYFCKSDCDNPRKIEGDCCPQCDAPLVIEPPKTCGSLELCQLRCEHGLMKNLWGCFECKCAQSDFESPIYDAIERDAMNNNAECTPLTAHNCNKQCAHGYLRDEKDCPACKCAKCPPTEQCYKTCLYGFVTNSFGCPVCKCRANRLLVDSHSVINGKTSEIFGDRNSCYSYSDENKKLIERDSGEWWTDNHCRQCFCQNKKEYCSLISCPIRPEYCEPQRWIRQKEDCCATCTENPQNTTLNDDSKHGLTVCHSPGNGRLFVDGETWRVGECLDCTCRMGHILCASMQCPPIPCRNPVPDPNNKCCLKCDESQAITPYWNFSSLEVGDNFNENSNEPNISLMYCSENSILNPIGSEWRKDECMSCRCTTSAKIECFREICANGTTQQASCIEAGDKSLMIKGQCCAVCSRSLSHGALCVHGENVYALNEQFRDGPCRNCSCRTGSRIECLELKCAAECRDPIHLPGQCCPICKNSEVFSFGEGLTKTVFIREPADEKPSNEETFLIYGGFLERAHFPLIYKKFCCKQKDKLKRIKKPNKVVQQKTLVGNGTRNNPENGLLLIKTTRNASESESANLSLMSKSSREPSTCHTSYSTSINLFHQN